MVRVVVVCGRICRSANGHDRSRFASTERSGSSFAVRIAGMLRRGDIFVDAIARLSSLARSSAASPAAGVVSSSRDHSSSTCVFASPHRRWSGMRSCAARNAELALPKLTGSRHANQSCSKVLRKRSIRTKYSLQVVGWYCATRRRISAAVPVPSANMQTSVSQPARSVGSR